MHRYLRKELLRASLESSLPEKLDLCIEEIGLLNIDVQRPPKLFPQVLSSPFAFSLASASKTSISPEEIAQLLVSKMDQNLFEVFIEGEGFINVNPSLTLVNEVLMDWTSRDKVDLSNVVDLNQPISSLLSSSSEEDARNFLNFVKQDNSFSEFDCCMTGLAILANADYDFKSFADGLGGSENLPWYFDYFLNRVNFSNKFSVFENDFEESKLLLGALGFSEVINSESSAGLVGNLHFLVHAFFQDYNHPNKRKQFEGPGYSLLAAAIRTQVRLTLAELKRCLRF